MVIRPQAHASDLDSPSMGVFDEVFTKRGAEESDCSCIFDEVFVRRGRWRKQAAAERPQQSRGNVLCLAEHVASGLPDVDYPVPSLSDISPKLSNIANSAAPDTDNSACQSRNPPQYFDMTKDDPLLVTLDNAQFVVKNTFINTTCLDYDSLREFLTERKVHTWPARDITSMALVVDAKSPAQDEVLNTASTFADTPLAPFIEDDATCVGTQYFAVYNTTSTVYNTTSTVDFMQDDAACAENQAPWKAPVCNTASTVDFMQDDAACAGNQAPWKEPVYNTASTVDFMQDDAACAGSQTPWKEPVYNTASTVDFMQDDAACAANQAPWKEPVFNTASTFTGIDLDADQQRIAEMARYWGTMACFEDHTRSSVPDANVTCPDAFFNPASACASDGNEGPQLSKQETHGEDKLRALRTRGSAITRRIYGKPSELDDQAVSEASLEMEVRQALGMGAPFTQHSSFPWQEAACTPGCTLSLCSSLQPSQQELVTPPPPPPMASSSLVIDELILSQALPQPPPPPMASLPVLRLADSLPPPELGSPGLPTVGSALHHKGECRPCAFFHTSGCQNGTGCTFCHLCGPSEKKKRLRQYRAAKRDEKLAAVVVERANSENSRDCAEKERDAETDCIVE